MPYGTGIYAPTVTNATYAELLRRAGSLLAHGELVIADASWTSAEHRAVAAAVAHSGDARLVQLRCIAPVDQAAQRLNDRKPGASDADRDIAQQMAADMAPWPEAARIDTRRGGHGGDQQTGVPADLTDQVIRAIRPPQAAPAWHPARPYMPPD